MRGGPYRIPAGAGCDHPRERPASCELCGKPCCSSCAEDSICAFCLLRAYQAMKWPTGAGRSDSIGLFTRISVIAALSLWIVTVAAVRSVITSNRVLPPVDVAAPAITGALRNMKLLPRAEKKIKRPELPPEARGAVSDPSLLKAPRLFDIMGVTTHDPEALLAYAERLAAAGTDVSILRADVSRAAAWDSMAARAAPAHITPVYQDGRVVGAQIAGLPADSLPIALGLANGDIITSINGYSISSPAHGDAAYQAARRAGMAVAEVLRGRRRIVLAATWPKDPPGDRRRSGAR